MKSVVTKLFLLISVEPELNFFMFSLKEGRNNLLIQATLIFLNVKYFFIFNVKSSFRTKLQLLIIS